MHTGQRDFPSQRVSCSVYKLRGADQVSPATAQGCTGHQPAGGVQLYCTWLAFLQFYSFFSLLFITVVAFAVFVFVATIIIIVVIIFNNFNWFQLLTVLISIHKFCLFLSILILIPLWGRAWVNSYVVLSCQLGLTHYDWLTQVSPALLKLPHHRKMLCMLQTWCWFIIEPSVSRQSQKLVEKHAWKRGSFECNKGNMKRAFRVFWNIVNRFR